MGMVTLHLAVWDGLEWRCILSTCDFSSDDDAVAYQHSLPGVK